MNTTTAPGPGWYPDPKDPGTNRYWDGEDWTDSRAPIGATHTAQSVKIEKEQDANGTIIAGYVFAALMPLIGFIIGLTQINRNRHGIWVIVVSVIAFFVWLAVLGSMETGANGGNGYTY